MLEAPLAISADRAVLAEVERVAAAAGVGIEVVESINAVSVAGRWRRAPLVLLDADQIDSTIAAALPRHDRVIVLAERDLDAARWASCLTLGVHRVMRLGVAADELVRLVADAGQADPDGTGGGSVLAVIGACGGAGGTVFAAALAIAATRLGRQVVVVDADPWSPGIDVALGVEAAEGARWSDITAPSGRLPADLLHRALPSVSVAGRSLSVLAHHRRGDEHLDPSVIATVIASSRRAGDLAVVDVARASSPAPDQAVADADLAILVVPAHVRGCYGATGVLHRLNDLGARAGLVVRGPSPGGLGAEDIARALDLPLLASMRPEPGLDRRIEGGQPPGVNPKGPLGRAAATVLAYAGVTR